MLLLICISFGFKYCEIKYKIICQTHLVYLLFIVELATCFDPAGSSSGLYVNHVMLKKYIYNGSCLRLTIY